MASGFRTYGKSKDHRDDLPQVVIGMAVTREGIPVRVWSWPGNTGDSALIRQVKDELRDWTLSRVVWVADCAFRRSRTPFPPQAEHPFRSSRTPSERSDLVRLHVERERHVVPQYLEHRVLEQVPDVPTGAGVETVHADDFASVGQ